MTQAYLDFQAEVGITKHTGGLAATGVLLALCGVERARDVLEVGCGIGVGTANLARDHGCHVAGVDRSPRMIDWARRRAREHGVEDRVELQVADATCLPFADGRFDIVIAESVLAFFDDPGRGLAEMVRVTRPGGRVGINESIWIREPTTEIERQVDAIGAGVRSPDAWRALLEAAGLQDIIVRRYRSDAAAEVRNRLRWVGLPWALRAWGRTIRLLATEPETRAAVRSYYGPGLEVLDSLGFGIFVGTKPAV